MGDLNINVGFLRDKWEEVIVNFLNELCLVDLSHGYRFQTPCRTVTRVQWMWSQKWGTTQHYLQLDYILVCAKEMGILTGMGFCFPQFLRSDHHAIVTVLRAGGEGWLKKYRRKHQKLPLSLLLGQKDPDTTALDALAAE
jgi:hypothetical protein